jgi:hypothetical protein
MTLVTLSTAREWMRVGTEVSDADLQPLIDAAMQSVEDFMGRPILGEDGWEMDAVPASVVHAVKVTLIVMYDNREAPLVDEVVMRALVGRYCKASFA